jgi:alkanesulfonate monooxygenase
MPVEMIGWIAPQVNSEIVPASGPIFSKEVLTRTGTVHEDAGFDRVLIGYFAHLADGFVVGAHTAAVTSRLGLLLAHRPGFVAPTVAARKLATLDQVSDGRLAVHIITGGSDTDQACDGDFLDHDARYRRTDEYLTIIRRMFAGPEPFDFDGEFYRLRGAYSTVPCVHQPHVPIYGGGGSAAAIAALAPHVDTFMLWGEPLAETRDFMARVRTAAAAHGRAPTFSVSTRPILAPTDGAAWDRAHRIVAQIRDSAWGKAVAGRVVENVGSQRLLDIARRQDVYDSCLFTALATASGAPGNSTALVGSPETVAHALVEYYKLGATSLLIRGYDPLVDAQQYGAELIPRVRELVAAYDRATATPPCRGPSAGPSLSADQSAHSPPAPPSR